MNNNWTPILAIEDISKTFYQGTNRLTILKNASLHIAAGEAVALVGPSGSGKSTLLQIAGLLDQADEGKIFIEQQECSRASETFRTHLRCHKIGFIYQFHHLLGEFSALENVMLAQQIAGLTPEKARKQATEILEWLGLKERLHHRPSMLSGGEQQRVAIARAIVKKPMILLADEPTGNLDPHTAQEVTHLLLRLVEELQIAALIVTHNYTLAQTLHRQVTISEEGAIIAA